MGPRPRRGAGGLHLGGTTNRIVPLEPPTYLELLGIGDPSLGDGAWLSAVLAGRDRALWWVLGTDDLDESARRRGLPVQSGTMAMADDSTVAFRTAGMPLYPRPFFVGYDGDPAARMETWNARYAEAGHDCAPGTFSFVEVGDPPELIDAWLGDHGLPVRLAPGTPPGLHAFGITSARGELVIR